MSIFLFSLNQLIELFVVTVRNNTKVYKHTHDEIYMTQVRIQLINSGVGVQIITPGALRCACVLKISFSYLKIENNESIYKYIVYIHESDRINKINTFRRDLQTKLLRLCMFMSPFNLNNKICLK